MLDLIGYIDLRVVRISLPQGTMIWDCAIASAQHRLVPCEALVLIGIHRVWGIACKTAEVGRPKEYFRGHNCIDTSTNNAIVRDRSGLSEVTKGSHKCTKEVLCLLDER